MRTQPSKNYEKYGEEQHQLRIVIAALHNVAVYEANKPTFKPEYFDSTVAGYVRFINKYHGEHGAMPHIDMIESKGEYLHTYYEGQYGKAAINDPAAYPTAWYESELPEFLQARAYYTAFIAATDFVSAYDTEPAAEIMRACDEEFAVSEAISLGADTARLIDEAAIECAVMPTGWSNLDADIRGYTKGSMALVCGETGVGKTFCLLSMALNLAEQKYNGVFVSLEMNLPQIMQRMHTMVSGIDAFSHVANKTLVVDAVQKAAANNGSLEFCDFPDAPATIDTIKTHIKAAKKRLEAVGKTLDYVVVDYLAWIEGASVGKFQKSGFEIQGENANALAKLAANEGILILSAAQMAGKGKDKAPRNLAEIDTTMVAGSKELTRAASLVIMIDKSISDNSLQMKVIKSRFGMMSGQIYQMNQYRPAMRVTADGIGTVAFSQAPQSEIPSGGKTVYYPTANESERNKLSEARTLLNSLMKQGKA